MALESLDYPFHARSFLTSHGNIHYIDEGRGDPIVFVHENPTWSFEFRLLVKEFSATHRCIAVDHLGFGLSDKPGNFDYLPGSHAKNLEALLLGLDLKNITFMFGDWGGPITLSLYAGLIYLRERSSRI